MTFPPEGVGSPYVAPHGGPGAPHQPGYYTSNPVTPSIGYHVESDADALNDGVPHPTNPPDFKHPIISLLGFGVVLVVGIAAAWLLSGCAPRCCPPPPGPRPIVVEYVVCPHPCPPGQVWDTGFCVWPAGDPP